MSFPLTLPAIGSINWGTAVNNNWTTLNTAFQNAPYAASSLVFTDASGLFTTTQSPIVVQDGISSTLLTGNNNEFFGLGAGNSSVTGSENTAVGSGAGASLTSALGCTLVGEFAGNLLTNGFGNAYFGTQAGRTNVTGGSNTYLGAYAGQTNTNQNNTYIGTQCGQNSTTSTGGVWIGATAGNLNHGNNNVIIGLNSSSTNILGASNVVIGSNTSPSASVVNSISIGDSCGSSGSGGISIGKSTAAAAGQLIIGTVTNSNWITDFYPNSVTFTAPVNFAIHGMGGSGTNVAGANLTLAGGIGTGTGAGGSVIVQTAPAGSTGSTLNTLGTALTIDQKGNIIVGNAALATTATNGFLYLETCAGAPTGTPAAFTGRAPIVFDTTNSKIWVYNGSWKGVVVA
jgi:hypothetical protein